MFTPLLAVLVLQTSRLQNGTNWSGSESLHFVSREAEIDETHRFKISFRVTGLEDKMWIVERRGLLLGSRISDTDIPPPPDPQPLITKEWLSPAGFLLDSDPLDKGQFYLDRMIHLWLPDNVPDEWSADLATTTAHYVSKGHIVFKRTSKTDATYSLTYTSPEDPTAISATGRMSFDLKTGRLMRAKIEAKQAILPGGTERANVTLTYTDSSLKATEP